MGWSYDPNLEVDKDRVRLMIGDVEAGDPLLSDEEIQAVLAAHPKVLRAAAMCADYIYRRLIKQATVTAAGFSIQAKERVDGYRELAQRLLAESAIPGAAGAAFYMSGFYTQERSDKALQTGEEQPIFTRDLHQKVIGIPSQSSSVSDR